MGALKNNFRVTVVVELDAHGYYAWRPELPGCQTQGDTLEEAQSNAQEVVELYLEAPNPEERCACLSKAILTTFIEGESIRFFSVANRGVLS